MVKQWFEAPPMEIRVLRFPFMNYLPPTKEEAKKFDLDIFFNKGSLEYEELMIPAYIDSKIVWWYPDLEKDIENGKIPYYCLYNCSTNMLKIVKNDNGIWSNIDVQTTPIMEIYGFLWKMSLNFELIIKDGVIANSISKQSYCLNKFKEDNQ